jgi:hypothetical protein
VVTCGIGGTAAVAARFAAATASCGAAAWHARVRAEPHAACSGEEQADVRGQRRGAAVVWGTQRGPRGRHGTVPDGSARSPRGPARQLAVVVGLVLNSGACDSSACSSC